MKQLYYACITVKNSGGNNLIKIVSLSLGLLIGLLLFSRVAYEASFNNFYKDAENLYLMKNRYVIGGKETMESHIVMAPMAPALNDEFPEVEYATTVFANKGEEPFFYEERKFDLKPLIADSLFFKTTGVDVLSGDDRLLGVMDNIFISDKTAGLIFGNENPIGKTLMYMHNHPYIIQGVYKDIPKNNSLRGDVIISFANASRQFGLYCGWDGGDSFWGVVRVVKGADIENINRKIPDVLRKHFDYDRTIERGFVFTSYLSPFKQIRSDDSSVGSIMIILSVLGLIMLLIATLNYVLISISSLTKRAKGIGIHKCSGASTQSIFSMFLIETAILIVISLAVAILLLLCFQSQMDMLMGVPMKNIFSISNLWVSGLVVLFLFLTGGILPARLFAVIPVTQIFHKFTGSRKIWKQTLLFFQFIGITFIALLLIISFKQYKALINKDLGYEPENVVYLLMNGIRGENLEKTCQNILMLQQELERFPFVEASATSMSIPIGYSGNTISDDEGNVLFSSRYEVADDNYISTMKMEFVKGGNFTGDNQVVVTEAFVKNMGWKDNPVGKDIREYGKITGVLKDYASQPLFGGEGYKPVLIQRSRFHPNFLTLRLSEITAENLKALNSKLSELHPNDEMGLTILKDLLDSQYASVRNFRNIILAACICIFLITLMGLVGYVNDEIQRRRKEIAIRKINGAKIADILCLIATGIAAIALPAILIATAGAFFVSEQLLRMFTIKTSLNAIIFVGGSIAILLVIITTVTFKSFRVACENPAKMINLE
ncbi:MAG: multidrug ABC transporter substrate-binding protein [Dysgonamonadaceae bacterium]|jgi:putative ABC transport system permease protein|nr:multidrug ABC transporter substrate-binding protein [Dysgonamonadaceae bacterium]